MPTRPSVATFQPIFPAQIAELLQLSKITDRAYQIQQCSAKTKEGLQEGMEWMVGQMNDGGGAVAGPRSEAK